MAASFQIEVMGGDITESREGYAFATIREGLFTTIGHDRDYDLYLLGYQGPVHHLKPDDEAQYGDTLRCTVRSLEVAIIAARNRGDLELADTLTEAIALLSR